MARIVLMPSARTLVRFILLGVNYFFALLDFVLLLVAIVDPTRAISAAFAGAIFITASCLLGVTLLFLILLGHKVFLGRGKGMGAYLKKSAKAQPIWLVVGDIFLFLFGIFGMLYPYAIGVANSTFIADNGQYFVRSTRGVTAEVSAEFFLRATTAAYIVAPVGASLTICVLAVMFLWGDTAPILPTPSKATT